MFQCNDSKNVMWCNNQVKIIYFQDKKYFSITNLRVITF